MYNKVITIGYLTRAIETRYMNNGTAIAKSAIATSHKYKSQTGEQKDEVCFLDFNIFGRSAEVAQQYLKKGSKVMLEGRLVLEQWTGQDGSKKSKHSLRVESMKMLDTKEESQALEENKAQTPNIKTQEFDPFNGQKYSKNKNIEEIDPFNGDDSPF